MSVDSKLYLNPRWELSDIIRVLERNQGKVKVESAHKISPGYFLFYVGNRQISVFVNTKFPTGSVTELMLASDNEGIKILRGIAEVLGGVLMENDYDCKCELILGAMSEDDALPYFIKFAIVHDGIDPQDTKAFLESKKRWHKEVEHKEVNL